MQQCLTSTLVTLSMGKPDRAEKLAASIASPAEACSLSIEKTV